MDIDFIKRGISRNKIQGGIFLIDERKKDKGFIKVLVNVKENNKFKLRITKSNTVLNYDVPLKTTIKIPIQLGNGIYLVELFQNIVGTQYIKLFEGNIKVMWGEDTDAFLCSNEIINFDASTSISDLLQKVTAGQTDSPSKIVAIYNYVIKNMTYDYDKINHIDSFYIPNIDGILKIKSGICYDYSVVFAAMLRKSNVPAKLITGYRSDMKEYHAWNEVWIDSGWKTVDTTWDSVLMRCGKTCYMVKDSNLYNAEKTY